MKRFTSFAAFVIFTAIGSLFCGCEFIPMLNYTVTYDDGTADADIVVPSKATYTVGATVVINFEDIGERPGYTFKCWSDGSVNYTKGIKENLTMGLANVKLTAIWESDSAPEPEPAPVYASYTVTHYKQNPNDDDYTLAYTNYLTGIAGEQTQAVSRNFEHYTADSITQTTIEEDGSTEVRINYSLETITYTLNLEGGTLDSETETIEKNGKYGQTVDISDPTWEGHTFAGWTGTGSRYGRLPDTFTENGTFTANWTNASVISVTISSESDLAITKTVTATTITLDAISGFTNYSWKIDGINATSINGVTKHPHYGYLTIPKSSLTPNSVYQVTLTATKNGIPYCAQLAIKREDN